MKSKLLIIGAGGQGRVCAEIAKMCNYQTIEFLDDLRSDMDAVRGSTDMIPEFVDDYDFFVAIGDNATRKMFIERVLKAKGNLISLVHPRSIISENVKIGAGAVVTAGAVINPGANIGVGAIVNTLSSVDHDCTIGEYSHIGVGSHLAGTVNVGSEAFIGAGAIVINNISIASKVIVGAGAVVIRDLKKEGTYVGVPVRKIK